MGASGSKTIPTLTLTGFEGRMATFFFTCSCTNSKGELSGNGTYCPGLLTTTRLSHKPSMQMLMYCCVSIAWVLLRENDLTLPYVPTVIMACFLLHNIAEQRAEPLPEADDRYMAMLAAYNAMFEGIELLGADEDGMGDNGGAAAAGGHLVPFG
ncbi:hypothetical protein V8C86DRAFT_3128830, partial [Haematococcus lacustris]